MQISRVEKWHEIPTKRNLDKATTHGFVYIKYYIWCKFVVVTAKCLGVSLFPRQNVHVQVTVA